MKYFDHDTCASRDRRIVALRVECGGAAVDAYWAVVEYMHEDETAFPEDPEDPIARSTAHDLCTDTAQLAEWLAAMERCGLLARSGGGYASERVEANVAAYRHRAEASSRNGKRGGRPRKDAAENLGVSDEKPRKTNQVFPENLDETKLKAKEKEKEKIQEPLPSGSGKKTRHRHGEYGNVLLTDEDLAKLQAEFPADWQQRIERLGEYMASTGKGYKNHLATIRKWARDDAQRARAPSARAGNGRYEPGKEGDGWIPE